MKLSEINNLVTKSFNEVLNEDVTLVGKDRNREAYQLHLLMEFLNLILQQTKQDLLDEKWVNQSNSEKGNLILHRVIDGLEKRGYL